MNTLIGENAGKVWQALQKGGKNVKDVKKELKLKEMDLYLALGWLAREDKVAFNGSASDLTIALK